MRTELDARAAAAIERDLDRELDDDREVDDDRERDDDRGPDEGGAELDDPDRAADAYAARFHALARRELESEVDLDREVSGLMHEMERDYLFGGLWKRLKRAGRGLVQRGLQAASHLPAAGALRAASNLARGNLKGMLGSLAQSAMSAVATSAPGLAALPALQALGIDAPLDGELDRAPWDRFVALSRDAFANLGDTLHEGAGNPVEAARLATEAFQTAVRDRAPRRRTIRVPRGTVLVIETC